MSPSRLEVSDHGLERLKQRRITRQQVRDCVYNGKLVGTDLRGRMVKHKKIGKRVLVVVYIEVMGGHMVVTAYWQGVL